MLEKQEIGTVESLRIDVLSETGWFDDGRFKADMAAYGGSEQSQYKIAWDAENAGGYAALLTLTLADGDERRILLDTGWNTAWMDHVFARHGIDALLAEGGIDAMVLSHWHLDHFWGIESTLKHNPEIRIYAPATWRAEDRALLREKGSFTVENPGGRPVTICANRVAHEGELILTTGAASTAAVCTGCSQGWLSACSTPRCCCRSAARTPSTSTSATRASSP